MKKTKLLSILSLIVVMITSLFITACGDLAIKEIQMDKNTFSGVYVVGEEIDYSKIQVKVTYEDGSISTYSLTDKDVSYTPIDTSSAGAKEFKVTVKGSSIVVDVAVNPALTSVEIFNVKTNFALNEEVDYSAILLKAIYGDDSEEFIKLTDEGVTYNQIDTSTAGEKIFTVEYKGKTANLTIIVSEPTVQSIEIIEGLKGEYKVGETLNASEIKLKVVKDDADSTVEYVYLNDSEVSYSIDLTSQGEKTLSVTYGGVTIVKVVSVIAVLQKIEFKSQEGLVAEYKTALDYANILINVIYNDANLNETIAINDERVTVLQDIDINEIGKQTLIVEFEGKQASVEVEVVNSNAVLLTRITLPQSYKDFQLASAVKDESLIAENEFAIKGKPYIVGNVNRFKFVPVMKGLDMDTYEPFDVENPITTYILQLKGENGEYATVNSELYIESVIDNMYKFNTDAEGKEFKLIVSPDTDVYDVSSLATTTATIEFKVEKAYNVYDVYGLSVMDNLNVKNWAKIKDRTLVYDDKKLSEYTDVTLIVLHNDILVDADKLPSNYFWSEKTPGYDMALSNLKAADNLSAGKVNLASKLVGSLRDGSGNDDMYNHGGNYYNSANLNTYDEDGDGVKEDYVESWDCVNMQKGLFNTNQCSISGNYMTITTKDSATRRLSTVISFDYKTDNTLKMTNPISHWSMFKFYKTGTEKLSINVENVFMQGNMPKVNEGGLPAGLMGINTLIDELTVDNIITSQFYTHIICDETEGAQSKLNFKNSRMSDAYSNMIYLWRSDVVVENCIMKNAGGPLFILCDGERLVAEENSYPAAQLKVDEKSVLESYAAGTEAWYTIFDATLLFNMFKGMDTAMRAISGKTYVHNVNGAEQINLVAVIIPSPDTILSARSNDDKLAVKGRFIKGEEVIDICDPIVEVVKGIGSVAFASNGQYAFMPDMNTVAPFYMLSQMGVPNAELVPGDFAGSSSNWLGVTMSAASLKVSNAPYFNVIISDFTKL